MGVGGMLRDSAKQVGMKGMTGGELEVDSHVVVLSVFVSHQCYDLGQPRKHDTPGLAPRKAPD